MKRKDFAICDITEQERWRKSLKMWFVISPEYESRGLGETDAPEIGCDVVEVQAATKRDALICGIKIMRQEYPRGWHNSDPSENPFKGVRVESWYEGDIE